MIAPDLLEILVCPECHQSLTLSAGQDSLKCAACHRIYPIRDGIPVLLVEEAKIEES